MTPEQARELLDKATPGPWRADDVSLCECCTDVKASAAFVCTADMDDAPLIAAAPALAHLVANMHYEYAVQNAETGTWLREESDGVVVHTSDPLAADWGTDLEEAKSYAVWITGEKLTEYRVMARLATAPEVVE